MERANEDRKDGERRGEVDELVDEEKGSQACVCFSNLSRFPRQTLQQSLHTSHETEIIQT